MRVYKDATVVEPFPEHIDMQDSSNQALAPSNIIDLLSLSRSDFFAQCFILLLGRSPESKAQHDAELALRLGGGRVPILINIYRSREAKEFRERLFIQSNDADFINESYKRYLGRPVEKAGLDHYLVQLKTQKRTKILAKLSRSAEARAVGTLWNDVEQLNKRLLYDRWPWRWASHRRRLHRLEQEIALHHTARMIEMSKASQSDLSVIKSARPGGSHAALSLPAPDMARQGLQDLGSIAEGSLGANSTRILRRMRALVDYKGQGNI